MRIRLAAFLLLLTAAVASAKQPTTVILVRHAEKAGPSGDVPLSDAGMARARELARVLTDANVRTIYVTQFVRTQQTAEPTAKATGVAAETIQATPDYPKVIAARVAEHPGETLLVVGHSNTTQDVIRQLGIADAPAIADSEYDNLFIVTLADGTAKLTRLRFGAPVR
jgi:broad specificity phosphatase PhoE